MPRLRRCVGRLVMSRPPMKIAPASAWIESRDTAQRRGLAAAARAEQREQLSAPRVQPADVGRGDRAVRLAQALDGQERARVWIVNLDGVLEDDLRCHWPAPSGFAGYQSDLR